MSLKEESGRFFFHFREIFEKCIEHVKFLIHFREILNFCLKRGTFSKNFYQFNGSFPGVSLMMREVSHVCPTLPRMLRYRRICIARFLYWRSSNANINLEFEAQFGYTLVDMARLPVIKMIFCQSHRKTDGCCLKIYVLLINKVPTLLGLLILISFPLR